MAYSVDIHREPNGVLYDIRGAAERVAATFRALQLAMPASPNTFTRDGDLEAHWIGRERWLLRSCAGRELDAALSNLDQDPSASVVDVSGAYTMFAIAGADADEVMAQASPLDIHRSAFAENAATFTEFFGQTALVARSSGGFLVAVDSSYADFIEAFLERARG